MVGAGAAAAAPAAPADWRDRLPDEYPEHVEFSPVQGKGVGMFLCRDFAPGDTVLQDRAFFSRPQPEALLKRPEWTEKLAAKVDRLWAHLRPLGAGGAGGAGGGRDQVKLFASAAMVRSALGYASSAPGVRRELLKLWHPEQGSEHALVGIARQLAEICADSFPECAAFEVEELQRAILVIEMNMFAGGRVFKLFSRVNHSCDPNVVYIGSRDSGKLKALRPLRRGEELVHCYLGERRLLPAYSRRWHLWRSKCFGCSCERCEEDRDLMRSVPCRFCARELAREAERMRAMRWRVVHKPGVWLRELPSTSGSQMGWLMTGSTFEVSGRTDGLWVEYTKNKQTGWVLTDGKGLGLGQLCVPDDTAPEHDVVDQVLAWGSYRHMFLREWHTPPFKCVDGLREERLEGVRLPALYISDTAFAAEVPHAAFEGGRWRCPRCGRDDLGDGLLEVETVLGRLSETTFFSPEIVKAEGSICVGSKDAAARLSMIRDEFLCGALRLAEVVTATLGHRHWSTQWARILFTDIAGSLSAFGSHRGFCIDSMRDLCLLWEWLESLDLTQAPGCWLHTRADRLLQAFALAPAAMRSNTDWHHKLQERLQGSNPAANLLAFRNYILEGSVTFG